MSLAFWVITDLDHHALLKWRPIISCAYYFSSAISFCPRQSPPVPSTLVSFSVHVVFFLPAVCLLKNLKMHFDLWVTKTCAWLCNWHYCCDALGLLPPLSFSILPSIKWILQGNTCLFIWIIHHFSQARVPVCLITSHFTTVHHSLDRPFQVDFFLEVL
jgi:hypothetical protein